METKYKVELLCGQDMKMHCGTWDDFSEAQKCMEEQIVKMLAFEGKMKADWEELLCELPLPIANILRSYAKTGRAQPTGDLEGETANYTYSLEDGHLEVLNRMHQGKYIKADVLYITISNVGLDEDAFFLDTIFSVQYNKDFIGVSLEEIV